jgi:UPF0755 protein
MKIIIIIIITSIAFIIFVHFRSINTISQNNVEIQFDVEKGDDIITIGRNLAQENLIANRFYFYYYVWQNKLRGSITAGEYILEPGSNIAEIVYKMTNGDTIVHKSDDIKITFPEGWTMEKMSKRLNEKGLPGEAFLILAQNPPKELYDEYSFLEDGASLEGYLFPDTYFLVPDTTAIKIIKKMLDNFDKKVDENYRNTISQSGNTLHDVIIFASVIEGEVSSSQDRQIVAGIFKNRLDINMALQSDATIDYIKGMPEIKHTQADIEIDSPYNTYKYPGLPPGPINNPSLEAIDAAIAPQETKYMYFLNNAQTGDTIFSETFDEHIVNKYSNGL